MNDVTTFKHPSLGELRVIDRNGSPCFVAIDTCRALEIANSRDAIKNLDDDEVFNVAKADISEFNAPNRGLQVISESGLWKLIFRSRKPAAKALTKWVTSEVLPSIRKTGTYSVPSREPALEWSEEACILRAKAKAEQMLADHLFQKMVSDLEVKAEPAGNLSIAPLAQERIDRWLRERCVFRVQAETLQMELYNDYATWCEANFFRAVSRKRFGIELSEREVEKHRRSEGYVCFGITLATGGEKEAQS